MPGNTFGKIFRVTTFGESHGTALGCIVDGCPAGIKISERDIQKELDRRKPGTSEIVSPRKELDKVQILSGVFEGKTLGTPIAMVVYNHDVDSSKYSSKLFRAGHADKAYLDKYGIRDWRGGGRASGRETLARVAAGAIAKKILASQVSGKIIKIGDTDVEALHATSLENLIMKSKKALSGEIQITVKKVPKNLGEPVFDKLKADLAKALLSIGAVYSFEYNTESILGGISTGKDIIINIKVKSTPSFGLAGRHDPCLAPRIVPVAEAMVNLVLIDHYLRNILVK
ncbi:MAG: chorismate synthase [Patescibacteria group bacterium]